MRTGKYSWRPRVTPMCFGELGGPGRDMRFVVPKKKGSLRLLEGEPESYGKRRVK